MKRAKSVIYTIMMMFMISACAGRTSNDSSVSMSRQEEIFKETEEMTLTASPENCSDEMPEQEGSKEEVAAMDELCLSVGDKRSGRTSDHEKPCTEYELYDQVIF